MIRVIVADDHRLFVEGIVALFNEDKQISISATYSNGRALLDDIDFVEADVLLLDIKMGQPDGIEILNRIRRHGVQWKVIIVSTYTEFKTVMACKQCGAHAFIAKYAGKDDLLRVIHRVIAGEIVFDDVLVLNQSDSDRFSYFQLHYKITPREWEIMIMIKQQLTNQDISEALNLSIYTVETHRKNIMKKLELRNALALHHFFQLHDL